MTMLKSLSAAGTRQIVVNGRCSNAISGHAIVDAALSLDFDPSGDAGFLPLPATLVRRADGWFAFHLATEMLPRPSGDAPALRLTASAPGHVETVADRTVTPAELALTSEVRTIAGHEVTLVRADGAPFRIDPELSPLPVGLSGFVLVEGDSEQPASGADVAIVAPAGAATVTNDDGSFDLPALPVAAELTIRVTHEGNSRDHLFRPDFAQRINRAVLATA